MLVQLGLQYVGRLLTRTGLEKVRDQEVQLCRCWS